jgi:hypothetical protein
VKPGIDWRDYLKMAQEAGTVTATLATADIGAMTFAELDAWLEASIEEGEARELEFSERLAIQNEQFANTLVERIRLMVPQHPEILELDSAWNLFKIPGFAEAIAGLSPTLAQAQAALSRVIAECRESGAL